MKEKHRYSFQKDSKWKMKFRAVLLVPLLIVLAYIFINLPQTESPTGNVINAENNGLATGTTRALRDLRVLENINPGSDEDNDDPLQDIGSENDLNGTENIPASNDAIAFSPGISSSQKPDSNNEDTPSKQPSKNETTSTQDTMPKTTILAGANLNPVTSFPVEFWGTITVGGMPANDGIPVKAKINGTIVASTETFQGYYQIHVYPDNAETTEVEGGGEGAQVTLVVDKTDAGTFGWSSGSNHEDLDI